MSRFISRSFSRAQNKRVHVGKKSLRNASRPEIEGLEGRVFLSVSVSTLIGPTSAGSTWKYETLEADGTVVNTNTETLVGTGSFMGQNYTEIDSSETDPLGTLTGTSKNYSLVTSAGVVGYGGTSVINEGGATSNVTTTYAPPEIDLPATMVAGTPYVETTTQTVVTTGITSSTDVVQISNTLTLEADTKPVSVPAANYPTAFVIDETLVTTSTNTISGL